MNLRFFLFLPLLLTVACTSQTSVEVSLETPDGPLSLPQADSAEQAVNTPADSDLGKASDDAWWRRFQQPRLDALIDEALATNYDLRAAAAAMEAAASQARIAGADLRPQVEVGLGAARQKQVFLGLPIPAEDVLKSTWTAYDPRIHVAWEADLWGRVRSGRRAAVEEAAAAEEELAAARLSLAAQTAQSFFELIEARGQQELAEATVESRRRTMERADARYRGGVGDSLDLRLARTALATAEGNAERRRRVLDLQTRRLEALLGRYPEASLEAVLKLPELPDEIPEFIPAEFVTRRPDLRAAERRLAAAGWRLSEARRALYPRLRFSANAGTSSEEIGNLLSGDFSVWSLAGGLLQPLFQGGRLRATADFAAASRERALADYVQRVLLAFAEVESALAADRSLRIEAESALTAAEESTAAADLAYERYSSGIGDYLLVLESQRQAFAAESALLSVRRQRLNQRVLLYAALAGSPSKQP